MEILLKILGITGIVLACAVGAVIVLILCILPSKVKVRIGYINNKFILSFKYLFLKYSLTEEKGKEKKNKKPKTQTKSEKPKKEKKDGFFKQKVSGFGISDYIELIKTVLEKFVSKIRFEKINAEIVVASDDASQTALNFGRINAAVYPIVGLINGHNKVKNLHISITPDFTQTTSTYTAEAVLYVRVVNAISAVISIIKYLL